MYRIRKKFKFEMAHQLSKAFSSCCSDCIHGHSYILELFFTSDVLDETGMVIDFGKIKEVLNDYLATWDHALVMPDTMDSEYLDVLEKYNKVLMRVPYNPTAEAMSKDIFDSIVDLMDLDSDELKLEKVRLHETETGYAEYIG